MSDTDDPNNPLGLHFEHEWQREAWEAEMAERRERSRKRREDEIEQASGKVIDLLERIKPPTVADTASVCELAHGEVICDRQAHYVEQFVDGRGFHAVSRRCPAVTRREVQSLVKRERERLAGELAQLERMGSIGFDGYDIARHRGAGEAWRAVREFSQGRPPKRNVFLAGTTGLGKTRLLLASHFALLDAGVRSVYVTSPDLRSAFDDQRAFDEEIREQGNGLVERLVRTQAVHLDDLGNVEDDERKRGQFAEGLKKVLDRSKAAWLAATNLTWDEATRHPDVGQKVLSRLVSGAVVVRLEGVDYRIAHAERRK